MPMARSICVESQSHSRMSELRLTVYSTLARSNGELSTARMAAFGAMSAVASRPAPTDSLALVGLRRAT